MRKAVTKGFITYKQKIEFPKALYKQGMLVALEKWLQLL